MIKVEEFKERRNKLYDLLEEHSVLVLYSGVSVKRSADESFPFTVNRNFYYLTNIKQEDSIFLAVKLNGVIHEYLFVSEYDELKEKWTGKRLTVNEAKELSGIDNILYTPTFNAKLKLILDNETELERINHLYLDLEKENKIGDDLETKDIANGLSLNYDNLEVIDVYEKIIRLRMIKSQGEIEEFKEAISKTNIGLQNIMKNIKPGLYEYQLSSLFYYTIQDYDYSELSFPTIAAGGVNATCLHYPTPISKLNDNELCLFDLGAQNNMYCADISRTYPVNGKFNDLQRKIYEIVLGCNKLIIKLVKPGITIAELQQAAINYLASKCVETKLIEKESDISKYYFHNISHHIGLDTHDPSFRNLPLEEGNIISDEPGLYFKELGIGIRIEDDILVTSDGSYNLSGKIIKEINDIERFMSFKN